MADDLTKDQRHLSRRSFLLAAAAVGAGAAVAQQTTNTKPGDLPGTSPLIASGDLKADTVNVAVIGTGAQGRVLIDSCRNIPGVRFVAVCDIWEYSRRYASRYLSKYGHKTRDYEDFREMLDAEKDLDAVIVATPDFMHATHTNACLERGLHVYCEKEMSNSLDEARSMVETQRKTGKLLQIGHQRRSNPRYIHAIDNLMHGEKLLGRVNHAYAQWNRSKSDDLGWPEKHPVPEAILEKYGYKNMSEFRNWRWYKKYGGGPIVDLGSHQIDIFNWVFKSAPVAVTAVGGVDYYPNHEWYDNVYAVYDYETPEGIARAFYKVLTTTKHGQFYETFMGDEASMDISELVNRGNWAWREDHADLSKWEALVERGWLKNGMLAAPVAEQKNAVVDVRATPEAAKWPLPVELDKLAHQPHLENFFDAIRKDTPLNCPADVGYESAVTVLKVNEAVAAARKLAFTKDEFHVA